MCLELQRSGVSSRLVGIGLMSVSVPSLDIESTDS